MCKILRIALSGYVTRPSEVADRKARPVLGGRENLSWQTLNKEIRSWKVENGACPGSSWNQFGACIARESDDCRYGKHAVLHPGTTLYAGWSVHGGKALKRAILKTLRIGLKRV